MMHPKGLWNRFLQCTRLFLFNPSRGCSICPGGWVPVMMHPKGIVEWVSALFPGLFPVRTPLVLFHMHWGRVPVMMHPKGSWNGFLRCSWAIPVQPLRVVPCVLGVGFL